MSPAEVIRAWLIEKGLGTENGPWKTFVAFLPETPDSVLAVYDTAGSLDGRLMKTGERIEHPGIQVFLRARKYQDIFARAKSIAKEAALTRNFPVEDLDGTVYIIRNMTQTSALLPLGVEEGSQRRHLMSLNWIVTIERT